MKHINLSNVQEATEFKSLPADGYVCKYINVEDVESKEYLYMEFDIAEGPYEGYYKQLEERAGFWGGKCYRSYKEKALPMFKRMCSAVCKSNVGFIFDGGEQNADEKTLKGKLVGIVFGEEEYVKNNGDTGTRLYVARECEVEKIRNKDFKVPPIKRLDSWKTEAVQKDFMDVSGEEGTPFD